jgi:hypothetical protein
MQVDHDPLGESFGAGGGDIGLAELVQHGAAHDLADTAQGPECEGHRGQNHELEPAVAGRGEPAEANREEQDQHQTEPEVGGRDASQGDDSDDPIDDRPRTDRRDDAEQDR